MFKLGTKTRIGLYISIVNSILVLIGCVLFFLGYYFLGINQMRGSLLSEAQEIITDHLLIEGDRIVYQQDKNGFGLEQDLLRDQASVVIYNKDLQLIGAFGIYELQQSILSNNRETEYHQKLQNVLSSKELQFYSELDITQDRNYEVLIYPISQGTTTYGLVQVAMPTLHFDNLINLSFTLFLILVPLSFLVNFFLGQLIAKYSYKPIDLLIKKMQKVSVTNLEGQIELTGSPDDEVYQLAKNYNSMIERINEGVDKQKQFIANASHELKSPLTRVLTGLEVIESMQRKNLPVDQKIKASKAELLKMGELIDKLLVLSKVKEQKVHLDNIDLGRVLSNIAKKKGYSNVHVDVTGVIKFPLSYFLIITENLLDNAYKYSPKDSVITIRSDKRNGLIFENDLKSEKSEMNESFMERFKRGRNTESQDGYGIGLSIVKTICDEYGIIVNVTKKNGKAIVSMKGFSTL